MATTASPAVLTMQPSTLPPYVSTFTPTATDGYLDAFWDNSTTTTNSALSSTSALFNITSTTSNASISPTHVFVIPTDVAWTNSNTPTQSNVDLELILEPDLRVHHPALAVVLGMICVIVVFGNMLTMISIYRERYLHTVTNYFVASLAAADCLVGAIVMPFSVVHEVMNKWWIFGQDW